jgi:hypothetical protein
VKHSPWGTPKIRSLRPSFPSSQSSHCRENSASTVLSGRASHAHPSNSRRNPQDQHAASLLGKEVLHTGQRSATGGKSISGRPGRSDIFCSRGRYSGDRRICILSPSLSLREEQWSRCLVKEVPGFFAYRKFLFSLSHQEGLHSYRPSCFCGRVGLSDINNFAAPPAAASGDFLPSVYTPWDGNQPEPHAHIERRGERGGWGKSGPRSPYCGP